MKSSSKKNLPQYHLEQDGSFVIENYNQTKTFSNFFPGIAGIMGIPMWVFYVNRGQCISSFGIESKDKSILEFQPANKAYRLTSTQGFRTFLKIKNEKKSVLYEPFQNPLRYPQYKISQHLRITSSDLELEDINLSLGIKTKVNYFTLPYENYAALVRRVDISNISKKDLDLEMIDGLPGIIPYGMNDWLIKNMSRTVEAWVVVENQHKQTPFFHLKVVVNDKPAVEHIHEGNFYLAFDHSSGKLLQTIVEAEKVFGQSLDFLVPEAFLTKDSFTVPKQQETSNRTPSAMSFANFRIKKGAQKSIVSLIGSAHNEALVNKISTQVRKKGFWEKKSQENQNLIKEIKQYAFTQSSSSEFNQYTEQTFLDNVLRGGLPISITTEEGPLAFNVYSRKHGDPERDYNFFLLAPTFFSQGNGNYRDVNQNRRNDPWFNRDVKDQNVVNFLNLVQADGYNPLVVKGMSFFIEDAIKISSLLTECVEESGHESLRNLLAKGFQPGDLLKLLTQNAVRLKIPQLEFFNRVLGMCHKQERADHGEGYWSDHWTYNLDLIESFLALYPEELDHLLFKRNTFSFYFDGYYILPRDHRYILTELGVRQYHSVFDATKEIKASEKGNKLRTKNGDGAVYHTTLFIKLLCLIANKTATLDPNGIGIEMEADKPNWYDALNGLPGLLGSSVAETLELKRLTKFILESFEKLLIDEHQKIKIFEELATFISGLLNILAAAPEDLAFWMKANDVKEHYRSRVRFGISGDESEISLGDIKRFLMLVHKKTSQAAEKAKDGQGVLRTYFAYEVTKYDLIDKVHRTQDRFQNVKEYSHVRPLEFIRHDLPLFLEGFVHALRVEQDPSLAKEMLQQVRKSPLYDKKLKMYRVNADLSKQTEEIGRTRIFPRGWLENESIWLHMEYKFLLEILRRGMYEEFYENFRNVLIPYLKPEQYGRSILENSSFIVSSSHEDETLHGRGFVARLSGSTAEFLHIWLLMNMGAKPFFLNEKNELNLRFSPALPGWLFTNEESFLEPLIPEAERITLPANSYAFNLLNGTLVIYHNPRRVNTFGKIKAQIQKISVLYSGQRTPVTFFQNFISAPHAKDIRDGKIKQIDVYFD